MAWSTHAFGTPECGNAVTRARCPRGASTRPPLAGGHLYRRVRRDGHGAAVGPVRSPAHRLARAPAASLREALAGSGRGWARHPKPDHLWGSDLARHRLGLG